MEKNGLSQEELGEKLNVTMQTVSKWELGQSKPDTDKLMEISKLLNVDFNQLVDDNMIIEEKNNNKNVYVDEVRPRKWLLILLIVIAIIIVIILASKFIGDMRVKANKEDSNSVFDNFFDSVIEETDSFSDFEIRSFNSTYEHLYAGSNYGSSVVNMLDKVITNNKTNSDRIIRVIYGDINTINEDEIRSLKKGLDSWTKYEVIFDYDEVGFINQVTIEK